MNEVNRYVNAISQVHPTEKLVNETVMAVADTAEKRRRTGYRVLRPLIALAAVIVLLVGMTPVLAANNETVNNMLYHLSADLALKLRPVELSSVSNGICMKVIAASVEGNTALAYIELSDLEANRIDETTDLYDSYVIRTQKDCTGHCERLDDIDDAGTCTYIICLETMDGSDLVEGYKASFSVAELLCGGEEKENQKINIDLAELPVYAEKAGLYTEVSFKGDNNISSIQDNESGNLVILGGGYPDEAPDMVEIMYPGQAIETLAENMSLTGAAVINGKLHIQMRIDNKRELDPHGFFRLRMPDGNILESCENVYFTWDRDEDGHADEQDVEYEEFIFETEGVDLSSCELYGDFYTNSYNIKGNWNVTFSIEIED